MERFKIFFQKAIPKKNKNSPSPNNLLTEELSLTKIIANCPDNEVIVLFNLETISLVTNDYSIELSKFIQDAKSSTETGKAFFIRVSSKLCICAFLKKDKPDDFSVLAFGTNNIGYTYL